ncbi:laccase-1-like [Mizuhopecten yessoensis]|uniref:Laccase-2 n=1 Tax=Mizuhopecten yessoensis TaxID=6573 RepID=A0A210R4H1_MIZYE|nr:laccase-1-like [Mizuhopecten yessoensis]OWF55804.1 Laccase-2 [Mizuhopecten yessoensis]
MVSSKGGIIFLVFLTSCIQSSIAYECPEDATECETTLVIQHRLTMMHKDEKKVYPYKGKLYKYSIRDPDTASPVPTDQVMTADGWEDDRLVVVANESLPGPDIIVYSGQRLKVHIINKLASDSVTIHWHGLPQHRSQWMDGVPFVTQCPILAGQTFTYDFIAEPKGTYWYHSHTGAQRVKGLNGAFVIRERQSIMEERIMTVQGWNHHWGADMDHQKMNFGSFQNRVSQSTSDSVDGGHFSRFFLHSVLINGRGRYYSNSTTREHNGAPLSVFTVDPGTTYRFRVIHVGALYPIRVSIDSHELTIIASDGYDVKPVVAESFVINPGERYDFTMITNQTAENYWVRAETLEIGITHKTEAILHYSNGPTLEQEPTTLRRTCAAADRCLVVNCPFTTFPADTYTDCLRFDHLRSLVDNDPAPVPTSLDTFREYHLNFGFPGIKHFPSSINGRKFKSPQVSALTQPYEIDSTCDKVDCGEEKHCECTHTLDIRHNDVVQLVLTNMGIGTGWSHPVHLHGYSFYVLKMGYATYNMTTAKFISQNTDIDCRGNKSMKKSFCNDATWRNSSWLGNNVPGIELSNAPRKDTLIIPSGGYAVIRIKADNPGVWMIHCHIMLHSEDGMVMLLNNSYDRHPSPPKGFPICHGYPSQYREHYEDSIKMTPAPNVEPEITPKCPPTEEGYGMKTFWIMFTVLGLIILFLIAYILHLRKEVKTFKINRKSNYVPENIPQNASGKENPAFETVAKY